NGKIDRSKLPMAESSQRSDFVAPRTPVEQNIAEIWAEVLRVDRVGLDDNFFDLGGHSLLATQVISRMRGVFNYDIALRTIFEAPTVAELAAMIIRQQAVRRNPTILQLSDSERHRLLVEWNDTKRDYPSERCIHELFEEQAERTPEAVAVVFDYLRVTHRE